MVVHDGEIRCPLGTMPLRGSQWTVEDYTRPGYRLQRFSREVAGFLILVSLFTWDTVWGFLPPITAIALLTFGWSAAPGGHVAVAVASGDRYYQVLIPMLTVRTQIHVRKRVAEVEAAAAAGPEDATG
jgi:hypothetical protein